jgi:hypothetical protein
MSVLDVPPEDRIASYFTHIDMGFLNRRLAITALGPVREFFLNRQQPGEDHMTRLRNDHLLVTMLIDRCEKMNTPTLAEALTRGGRTQTFMSIELLEPCPEIYESDRVTHRVHLEFECGKPVQIAYHTEHLVSSTGRMTLADGYKKGYRQAIIGRLQDRGDRFEIEPVVIGAPWLDHPRNPRDRDLMWFGHDYGEVLPEDIDQFSRMRSVTVETTDEWMQAMRAVPEEQVKNAIAGLLTEPAKSDWGGEENDHFSANVMVAGVRRSAAFLLKGPTKFQEMTPAMCGKNADQIYRLVRSGADVSVIQHSHLIGTAVRETLRAFVGQPGSRSRKFCFMDGQATYRLLKAYALLH